MNNNISQFAAVALFSLCCFFPSCKNHNKTAADVHNTAIKSNEASQSRLIIGDYAVYELNPEHSVEYIIRDYTYSTTYSSGDEYPYNIVDTIYFDKQNRAINRDPQLAKTKEYRMERDETDILRDIPLSSWPITVLEYSYNLSWEEQHSCEGNYHLFEKIYDANSRLIEESRAECEEYTYDSENRLLSINNPNETIDSGPYSRILRYDSNGLLTRIDINRLYNDNGEQGDFVEYTVENIDRSGNWTSRTSVQKGTSFREIIRQKRTIVYR